MELKVFRARADEGREDSRDGSPVRGMTPRGVGSVPMLEKGPRSGPFSIGARGTGSAAISSPPVTWEPELEELRRREELARKMGGDERVGRQHESGRLTVRERIERLFDAGTFHETGAIAGKADYDGDGELTGFLPACAAGPRTRPSGRRWCLPSGWRTTSGCRSCGSSTGPAAGAASSSWRRWASPTSRSSPAGSWWWRISRWCPWPPPPWDPWPDSAPRGWRRRTSRRSCAARRWWRPPWARRRTRRSWAGRGSRRRPVRSTTRRRTRTTRWTSFGASCRTCQRACGRPHRAAIPRTRRTGARRSSCRSCRGTAASPTRSGASSSSCSTPGRCSRSDRGSAARWSRPSGGSAVALWASLRPTPTTTRAG